MSFLEFTPIYGNANAYIMCSNLFEQVCHPLLVQYSCSFKDNFILVANLNCDYVEASTAENVQDLVVKLVKVFSYLTLNNIKPFYATLRISGNDLLVENWFYSLIQNDVDSLPSVSSENYLARLVKQILATCNTQLQDIPSNSQLFHAIQTLCNNTNCKDALNQASIMLEDCHVLLKSIKEPFYAPLLEHQFLKWAMQFGNLKKNKQPNLFSIEPQYVSINKDWSIPSGKPPLSPFKFDILQNFEQYKSSSSFVDGSRILAVLNLKEINGIPSWVRSDVYRRVFQAESDYRTDYLERIKLIDQETTSQIALDVPRCHSYHPILSSHFGKQMLKRILEAWCYSNPDLEYWQGIDSMAATFLSVFIADEAAAFHCFNAFIRQKLAGLFKKGNSDFPDILKVCQTQVIEQVPKLAELDLQPDVITVPWFLTAFSHLLPFRQVFILWDAIVLQCSTQEETISFLTKVGIFILQEGLQQFPSGTHVDDGISLVDKLYDIRDADLQRIVQQVVNTI